MIELRLQRGEPLAVDIDGMEDFSQQAFEPLQALIERTSGAAAIPDRPVNRAG
jgi:hypothetical protein